MTSTRELGPRFSLLLREAIKEAVASGRVEKLQPKEPQTWKTTRRAGKSFANGWRFLRTSDRRQIRPRPSPKGPSSKFQRSSREPYDRIMGWLLSRVGRS
jgi:hypothetical protein